MRFDPFTPQAIADPYPQYHRLRESEPVHWSDKLRAWVLFSYDDVVAFFRDGERLSSDRSKATKFKGPVTPQNVQLRTVASDAPAHTAVRAMLTASLNPRVRGMGPVIDTLLGGWLDRIAAAASNVTERCGLNGEVDLIANLAYPLPINVIAELLDVPEHDREQFQAWSHAVARGMDRFYSGADAREGLHAIGGYFLQIVQQRRSTSGDDLVHRLLQASYEGDRLTDLEVVAMCTALVFGGHETTVNLIGNGVFALLQHRDELERLRAHPEMMETAIEELLRFDSPAQLISRSAVTDIDLHGKAIKTGDAVLAALGAANRDPAVFADPDRLDLGRDPNPHVAFGLGAHYCPGAQLSRMEASAAIRALLHRFPKLELGSEPPKRRTTAVLRSLESLPVRLR